MTKDNFERAQKIQEQIESAKRIMNSIGASSIQDVLGSVQFDEPQQLLVDDRDIPEVLDFIKQVNQRRIDQLEKEFRAL